MAPPFGVYVHVPFCAKRCGYCDFNTYTPSELGAPTLGGDAGGSAAQYLAALRDEIAIARRTLDPHVVGDGAATVFFGGGTPTLLPPAMLGGILAQVRETFGLRPGAEVTVEANPDTVTDRVARGLAEAGVTRVSMGMQSSQAAVLATLDRTHRTEALPAAVAALRAVGLAVSLDVIYGTPGESLDEWRATVTDVIALAPDHISAYALTVEPGTAMGRRVRHGELATVDPDDQAAKYIVADAAFAAAGYGWYEISNWARSDADRCRHNLAYWNSFPWWGFGPGAHSHVEGRRWWNVAHPAKYAQAVAAGSAEAGGETLTAEQRRLEHVMLTLRLRTGLAVPDLGSAAAQRVPSLAQDGLVEARSDRVVLTQRGRLLADTVVHALTEDMGG